MSTPFNDFKSKNCGLLMANIQLLRYDPNKKKDRFCKPEQRKRDLKYKFYYQICQGFELASSISEDKLRTSVQIKIGDLPVEKCTTKKVAGRYPQWNYFDTQILNLKENLEFEADMKVTLRNEKKALFGQVSNLNIADFTVPLSSIMTRSDKP